MVSHAVADTQVRVSTVNAKGRHATVLDRNDLFGFLYFAPSPKIHLSARVVTKPKPAKGTPKQWNILIQPSVEIKFGFRIFLRLGNEDFSFGDDVICKALGNNDVSDES